MEIDATQAVIDDFVARGVFRAEAPKVSAGETATTWHLRWFGWHVMALSLSKGSVSLAPLLPQLAAQSTLYRELRVWLKAQQSAELPPHRRLDPAIWKVDIRNRGGAITLSLAGSPSGDAAVRQIVQLVHAVYLDFLNGPGRLGWVTEAFGLDPDNPRLS